VFDNRVLRKIFGPKRKGLHNEGLQDLYPSSNIIRGIKSRRVSWAGNVARIGEREVYTVF
jgi:hypothetical protein